MLFHDYTERWNIRVLAVEITDRIHLFLSAPPTLSPSKITHDIKGWTSYVLRKEFSFLKISKTFS
ncbi:MAG: transposase, partial [Candidatus Hermodarchaeota archaeon]